MRKTATMKMVDGRQTICFPDGAQFFLMRNARKYAKNNGFSIPGVKSNPEPVDEEPVFIATRRGVVNQRGEKLDVDVVGKTKKHPHGFVAVDGTLVRVMGLRTAVKHGLCEFDFSRVTFEHPDWENSSLDPVRLAGVKLRWPARARGG